MLILTEQDKKTIIDALFIARNHMCNRYDRASYAKYQEFDRLTRLIQTHNE